MANGHHPYCHPLPLLQVVENGKQPFGMRIATDTKHAHQALRGGLYGLAEIAETQRAIDKIPKHDLARGEVPGVEAAYSLLEVCHAESPVITEFIAERLAKCSCNWHHSGLPRLAQLIVLPALLRQPDVRGLPAFDPAGEKDDNFMAIPAEVDPVPGPGVKPDLDNAQTHAMMIAGIPGCGPLKHSGDSCPGSWIELSKPLPKRAEAISGQVLPDVVHVIGTTEVTNWQGIQRGC